MFSQKIVQGKSVCDSWMSHSERFSRNLPSTKCDLSEENIKAQNNTVLGIWFGTLCHKQNEYLLFVMKARTESSPNVHCWNRICTNC